MVVVAAPRVRSDQTGVEEVGAEAPSGRLGQEEQAEGEVEVVEERPSCLPSIDLEAAGSVHSVEEVEAAAERCCSIRCRNGPPLMAEAEAPFVSSLARAVVRVISWVVARGVALPGRVIGKILGSNSPEFDSLLPRRQFLRSGIQSP